MKRLSYALITLLCAVLMTSCGGGGADGLLKAIPDDVAIVCIGDAKTVIESCGGSITDNKIKLPTEFTDMMSSHEEESLDEINDVLKNSGVDITSLAFVMTSLDSNKPVFVCKLADAKKFVAYIEDEGYDEKDKEDGITYYCKKSSYSSSYIAVKDSYAYCQPNVWDDSQSKSMRALEKMIEDAAEHPYSKTRMADYITKGNACGAAIKIPSEARKEMRRAGVPAATIEMLEGYVCFNGNLTDDAATVEMKLFDEDGKAKDLGALQDYYDISAKVSSKALKYLGKDESLVSAVAIKNADWDKVFDMIPMSGMSFEDRAIMMAVKEYLNKIDGTVAIGVGVTNGVESLMYVSRGYKVFDNLSFTAVVETKEGKAKGIINDLTGLMDSNKMPYESTNNGFSIEIPENGPVYVVNEGNFIIISNNKIGNSGKSPAVDKVDLTNTISGMALVLDKDNKIMRDLGLDYDIRASLISNPKEVETVLKVEVIGGKGGVLYKMIRMCLDIADQGKKLGNRYSEIEDEYMQYLNQKYGWYDDDMVCDTIAVEEYDYDYDIE